MADFPDLNDDGKVTRADVLKGRGVFKRGGKVKKMRKFAGGDMVRDKYLTGFESEPVENKLTSYRKKSPERKALGIGFQKGSPDYLKAVDALSTPEERASRIRNLPADTVQGKYENQALEKVKSTAMAAGKKLMDMTPQGVVAKGVTSMGKKYPRYSEGESSFEQDMGMKKGGKVSSASKRADGIAIRGKTRA